MPNPFETVLDPSRKGTLGGFIGGVIGSPTEQQRVGQAQGAGMDTLQQLFQQEGNAQRAFMKFLGTPQGQELFMRDPNALKTMADGLKMMQKPEPTITNVPAGGRMIMTDQEGNITKDIQNPSSEIQTFNEMAKIAQLSPEERQIIGRAAMLKGTDKSTVQSQALDKMVAEGKISIEMRNKILGGVIKSIPVRNEQGAVIGEDLVDLSTMQAIRTSAPTGGGTSPTPTAPGQGLPQPTNAPAERPGEPNPLQQGDEAILRDPKASMALAAGIAPVIGTVAGGLIGQLGVDLGTSEMSKRQAAQATLRSALAEIARQGEGLGISNKLLNTALDLAEFGTAMTPSIGPREANIKLRTLRQDVDDDYAAAERTMRDINLPQSVRSKAGLRLEALRNLQRSLPTVQQLDRMQAMIEAGTAGAWTPGTLMGMAESGLQQGTEKLKGQSQQQQQKDFSKMDEPTLLAIDPKLLSKNERLQYMNRIQELIAAKKKAQKKPDTSTKMDGKPRI